MAVRQDGQVKEDVAGLHPAFSFSGQDVLNALKKGQDLAKRGKPLTALMNEQRQEPRWVRGRKGRLLDSSVYLLGLDPGSAAYLGYEAARLYEPDKVPEGFKRDGCYSRSIQFLVFLRSEAFNARRMFERDRIASQDDVTVVKFVLSDDRGHDFVVSESKLLGQKSGQISQSGVHAVPEFGTSFTTGSAFGSGGYATGSATSTYTRTRFVPWSEQHPYFEAQYAAVFPLFDGAGKALVGPDVRALTLHIITPNGEQAAVYKLPTKKR